MFRWQACLRDLMCATLDALFSGKKELFKDLYISKTDYDFKKYPVLRFDFSMMKTDDYGVFLRMFQHVLEDLGEKYGCKVEWDNPSVMLQNILKAVENPVIIIDEFDSAIIEAVSTGNMELAEKMRSCFNSFYSVIKSYTPKIRFFFITGCTKLSGLNIFSAMNNLKDISREAEYSAMFGYTEEELEHYFDEHIDYKLGLAKDDYSSREEFLDALRSYYDGYRFSPDSEVKVYNPVSVGAYFSSSVPQFRNYWMQTGGASTLAVALARKADLLTIVDEKPEILSVQLAGFDITSLADEDIDSDFALSLLFYAGYLTISDVLGDALLLDFPNTEVRATFLAYLVKSYAARGKKSPELYAAKASYAAQHGDYDAVIRLMNDYYSLFNYTDLEGYKEKAVQILFKAFFTMLSMSVYTEVPAGKGRCDAVLITPKYNYLIEFKADGKSSDEAMDQMIRKHYAALFTFDSKPLHLIGIDFRTETKRIVSYSHQLYGSDKVETYTI